MSNEDKAAQALAAVNFYRDLTNSDEDVDIAIADLLADLLHLCHIRAHEEHIPFDKLLANAKMHFEAEVRGEE